MKKIRIIAVVMLIVALLAACGSKSSLVGRWEAVDDGVEVDYGDLDELEFFSDGTYTSDSDNYSGSYSVDGNRLRISGVIASSYSFDFKVSGNSLIIHDDENDRDCEYTKVSD